MVHLLAQSLPDLDPSQLDRVGVRAVDAFRSAARLPAGEAFWQWVASLGYIEAAVSIAIGLVYLLYGFKIFKVLVIINAAALGAWAGWLATQHMQLPVWTPAAAGVAAGVLAWPLMRYAVCLMGGLAGSLIGAYVARSMAMTDRNVMIAAVVGLAILGMLSFVVFRVVVIGFTALQGALLAVAGIVAIVARSMHLEEPFRRGLASRPLTLLTLVLAPAAVGFVYQVLRKDGDKK